MKNKLGPREGAGTSKGFLICTRVQRMQLQDGMREAAGYKVVLLSLPKLVAARIGIQGLWNKVVWGYNVILLALTVPCGMTIQ